MPIFRKVDKNFFKNWSPEMAYVLGFFVADGNMVRSKRGNHYLSFYSCDREIIEFVKRAMQSEHKIGVKNRSTMNDNWKDSFQLQIGSKEIFNDLLKLGFMPRKSKICRLNNIPDKYLADFVRGYFDGDGNVWVGRTNTARSKPSVAISAGFTSGSKAFIHDLRGALAKHLGNNGSISFHSRAYRLRYSIRATLRLYDFMYNDATLLFMLRKREVFEKYLKQINRC